MNLFSKNNSNLIVIISKFSNQLYIITQSKKAISSQYFFQRFNPNRVVLKINTYRAENFYYTFRRVIRAKSSEVHLTLVSRKYEMHITLKVKEYVTLIIYKSKLTKLSKKVQLILVRVSYSKFIQDPIYY